MRMRSGVKICSRGVPRYFCASFKTCTGHIISVPVCTAGSPKRVRCVVGSTRVRALFINRRLRCGGTFGIRGRSRCLGHLIIFSPTIGLGPRSGASVCFSSFLQLNSGTRTRAAMGVHAGRTIPRSLTAVVCASKAAKRSGNIVLRRSGCLRTVHVRSVHLPVIASGSLSVYFLPLARVFRGT